MGRGEPKRRQRDARHRRGKTRRQWSQSLRFLAVFFALTSSALPARAADILAVLGSAIPPYERALRDFRTALARLPAAGPKAIEPDAVRALVLPETGPDALGRAFREQRADLVLAVGRSALAALADLGGVPVLYVLAPSPAPLVRDHVNITGVALDVPPRDSIAVLRDILPKVRRLGLLYDPDRTGALVAEARAAAVEMGVALTAGPVHRPREVATGLEDLAGKVDALWLVPDLTVAGPEGVEAFALFSQEHGLPVISFSPYHVQRGATLSVSADPETMARQAAAMARRLLAGEPPQRVPPEPPARVVVTVNRAVAAKLGVSLNPASPQTIEWVE